MQLLNSLCTIKEDSIKKVCVPLIQTKSNVQIIVSATNSKILNNTQ